MTSKTTYAGSHRARKPQRPRPHDYRARVKQRAPQAPDRRDRRRNTSATITTPRPTRARAPSPLRRANMSSKAKSAKEEAPAVADEEGQEVDERQQSEEGPEVAGQGQVRDEGGGDARQDIEQEEGRGDATDQTQGEEERPLRGSMEEGHVRFPLIYFRSHIYIGASSRSSSRA